MAFIRKLQLFMGESRCCLDDMDGNVFGLAKVLSFFFEWVVLLEVKFFFCCILGQKGVFLIQMNENPKFLILGEILVANLFNFCIANYLHYLYVILYSKVESSMCHLYTYHRLWP